MIFSSVDLRSGHGPHCSIAFTGRDDLSNTARVDMCVCMNIFGNS